MKRREFLTLLGGAAVACPLAARAQQAEMPVVGFLDVRSPDMVASLLGAFRQGLSESGYVEGRNVAIDFRWMAGRNDRLTAMAVDLVRQQVTMIVAGGNAQALAAKAATATIPIVFVTGDDPVKAGFVASLNNPGGNLTGVTTMGTALGPKRLELLHEMVPAATLIALLINPANPIETQIGDLQIAAESLGLKLHLLHASSERDFEPVFATLAQLQAGALLIGPDGFLLSSSEQLAALALRHAVPASLPVQQATKVELIVNLKSAKALGLTVPPALLARADEVIE